MPDIIGDSVHPMAPYIGMGANEALYDSYLLSKLIMTTDNLNGLAGFILQFHLDMSVRASKSVVKSRQNVKFYHSYNAVDKEKFYKFKNMV